MKANEASKSAASVLRAGFRPWRLKLRPPRAAGRLPQRRPPPQHLPWASVGIPPGGLEYEHSTPSGTETSATGDEKYGCHQAVGGG